MVLQTNHDMETTFYDEQYSINAPMENLKNRLSLNLGDSRQLDKFARQMAPILSSPDVKKMSLATPDLEKFIFSNATLATPTAGLFPISHPTEEQENYVIGFEKALQELQHGEATGNTIFDLDGSNSYPAVIKDEPQTVPSVPSTPPMSPIDMDNQEKIKLERKRMRNREAASKCRKRKLEKISKLEDKVKLLKTENSKLTEQVNKLKDHVCKLKQQVIEHVNSGCAIEQPPYC